MEGVNGLHFLARTHELDGLVHHGADAEGSTTTCVTIQLGENHTRIVQPLVELLGRVHGILSRHGIHHEENLVRMRGIPDVLYLLHQFLVNGQTARRIDDDHVVRLGTSLLDGILGHPDGVCCPHLHVAGHPYLVSQHLQLFHSGGAERIAGSHQWVLVLLLLQHLGQFTREGRLTRTVQTRHEDDGGVTHTSGQVEFCGLATHEGSQFVVYDLHHQLAGLHGGEHVLSQCLLLHRVGKILGHAVVDIGIQQGTSYVLERFCHIDFGYLAFTFQYLEGPFQSLA